MILGRGYASTDDAIITEFQGLVNENMGDLTCQDRVAEIRAVPQALLVSLGRPISNWHEQETLALYQSRSKYTRDIYNPFFAFLVFRGYCHPSFDFLAGLKITLSQQFPKALAPYRRNIEELHQKYGYHARENVGYELNLLIWALATIHKPLAEVTRADFDQFQQDYRRWFQSSRGVTERDVYDARLARLDRYLVQWGTIAPVMKERPYFAGLNSLASSSFRKASSLYVTWCRTKYAPSTYNANGAALQTFFIWLEDHYPTCRELSDVTRVIALEYGAYLETKRGQEQRALSHSHSLGSPVRHFFDFAIRENLDPALLRNPFTLEDLPKQAEMLPRYFPDHELQQILDYCKTRATPIERTMTTLLLHTGIRGAEAMNLKTSDLIQIQGTWKLHIRLGKGLKDRLIPLTAQCLAVLQEWQEKYQHKSSDLLFTSYGRPWSGSGTISVLMKTMGRRAGVEHVSPHRFRHTFAVALLNYGVRESVLQKLMGHATLDMTLEYARILDATVERSFSEAVERMEQGPISWVPNFFAQEEYTLFAQGDSLSWIQLPVGFCRRNPKLHCESDVKCFLCERFCATSKDLPRLHQMQERFVKLGLQLKAEVVAAQIQRLEVPSGSPQSFIPVQTVSVAEKQQEWSKPMKGGEGKESLFS